MTSVVFHHCENCWSPVNSNEENCQLCGYPDTEGENMTLEELINKYNDGEEFSDVRKSRLIDLLIDERFMNAIKNVKKVSKKNNRKNKN